jgi:type IV secretion system protein VirB4
MAVDGMLGVLAPFGAKRLGVVKRGASYYSATLEFFAKILNLGEVSVRMQVRDVSECIAAYGIAIGFNNMEVRGRLGKKFGAMFSLKEYYEVTGKYLDKILLLPQEFIITQTIDFINSDAALRNYKYQDYILSLGKDDELSEATGLKEIVNNQNAGPTAFGDSQITFFLIDSDVNQLEKNVVEFATTLSGMGYVAPRRDVRLEECFWAQLPGNFNYISRKKPISTGYVGGFASLYNYPAGRIAGNLWGSAVTMMHTVAGTPLFFSFHVGDNGHTAILGPDGMGKTVLMNFFVSEAQKFGGRLFFFDQDLVSSVFIKAMGGKYIVIDSIKASKNCAYNPFTLADTQENRIFLKEWLVTLAEYGNFTANNAEKAHIEKLVDYIYTIPYEYRKLSYIAKSFGEIKEGSLGQRMSVWHSEGKYAHLFDNDIDSMTPLDSMIYGFCMSSLVKDGNSLCPVLAYLFHLIEISLDGLPTIIVLDKAWSLVNNKVFAPKMKAWLERLRKKNALVIFATETVQNDKINSMNKEITESIATKLFLPNYDADDSSVAYKQVWGLSSEEFNTLSRMRPDKRQFMFKQGNKSVVTTLDLAGFEEVNILSGGDKTVKLMEEAINEVGSDHLQWLPRLYEKLKAAK